MFVKYIIKGGLALSTVLFLSSGAQALERWQDNFSSDSGKWNKEDNVNWPGNRSTILASNAFLQSGQMKLRLKNSGGSGGAAPYSGAQLNTKVAVGYGQYKARLQATGATGTDTGFFLYANSMYKPVAGNGSTYWQEIDFEFLGYKPNEIHTNVFLGSDPTSAAQSPQQHAYNFSSGFNEYQIIWRGDYIQWMRNGVEIRKKTDNMFGGKMFVYMNLWAPDPSPQGSWLGWDVGAVTGAETYSSFDWVNLYEY